MAVECLWCTLSRGLGWRAWKWTLMRGYIYLEADLQHFKPSITIIIQKKQTSGVSASSTTNYYTVITYQYPPIYRLSSLVSSHRTRALRSNAQYSTVISFSYTSIRRIKRFYTEIPLARGRKTNFFKRNWGNVILRHFVSGSPCFSQKEHHNNFIKTKSSPFQYILRYWQCKQYRLWRNLIMIGTLE